MVGDATLTSSINCGQVGAAAIIALMNPFIRQYINAWPPSQFEGHVFRILSVLSGRRRRDAPAIAGS